MFISSSWMCAAPFCWPGPTNQMSEPGSPQRRLARPELFASSASMACAIVPLAVTDQPVGTGVALLPLLPSLPSLPLLLLLPLLGVLEAAGTVSSESTPGFFALIALAGCSWTPAGGSDASSACPGPPDPAGPAISATVPVPPPSAGGQARAAAVTVACRVTAAGFGLAVGLIK